jgi:murein DD-endopeptidase MepM/ murein hydrolase activator NlpD
MRRRFLITLAREASDSALTIRVTIRGVLVAAALVLGSPILFVIAATWGSKALVADLLRQNTSLKMENANYRETTMELVTQVGALQAAADDLGTRASVDPEALRAMERLPSSITNRAMGGGTSVADVTAPLTTVASSADPAFGLLRDVVHMVERKLDHARAGVERREALAAATPSIWPVAGWLSSTFGSRPDPFTGRADYHAGLDISADRGDAVRATADGTVTTARYSGDFGNLVVLEHGFGIATRYGHLSRFGVSEGMRIRKGDVIGYVGSTGRSTGSHLHYELLLNGRSVNPMRLLGQ